MLIFKKFVFFACLSVALFSCSGNRQQQAQVAEGEQVTVVELDNLLAVAEQETGNTVAVVGYVTHTCKHSGKRCFIVGESREATIRVEATGDIESFSSDLEGSKLLIKGEFKERRLTKEDIDKMEEDVNQKKEEDGSAEACEAEICNINEMRQWMKEHDKEYYAIYYMDGISFEKLDSE